MKLFTNTLTKYKQKNTYYNFKQTRLDKCYETQLVYSKNINTYSDEKWILVYCLLKKTCSSYVNST